MLRQDRRRAAIVLRRYVGWARLSGAARLTRDKPARGADQNVKSGGPTESRGRASPAASRGFTKQEEARRVQAPNYLDSVPVVVPAGQRLVHNFPPARPSRRFGADGFRFLLEFGADGFRFWLEEDAPNPDRHPCECHWDAPAHWSRF